MVPMQMPLGIATFGVQAGMGHTLFIWHGLHSHSALKLDRVCLVCKCFYLNICLIILHLCYRMKQHGMANGDKSDKKHPFQC